MRLLLIASACCVSVPAAATVFNSASVQAGASAQVGNTSMQDFGVVASTSVPATIASGANASAFETDGTNTFTVNSYANLIATWGSANAGGFGMRWGWTSVNDGLGVFGYANTNLAIPNWLYSFTATGDGTFSGIYRVLGRGNTFGLQSVYGSGSTPFGPYGGTVFDPTGSGSFSFALVNGQTYSFGFYNYGNLNGFSTDLDASAEAGFDWKITYANGGVPEPASWAMLIAGFGLIGGAARRRRAIAA